MKGLKKLIAVTLIASLVLTTNGMYVFAEGNESESNNLSEVVLEPTSDSLNYDVEIVASTMSQILSYATNSEVVDEEDYDFSNTNYEEEPEDDIFSESISDEDSSETTNESENESYETLDENLNVATNETSSTYESITESESIETSPTDSTYYNNTLESQDNDQLINSEDINTAAQSEIIDLIDYDDNIIATNSIITEEESYNIATDSTTEALDLISSASEVYELTTASTSELIANEELFGTGEWIWWIVDDSNPDNITLHYYASEPTEYNTTADNKKGKTSQNSAPLNYSNYDTLKATIKTVVFEDTITAKPLSCTSLFSGFRNLTTITNISNLNTNAVTSMEYMFRDCSNLDSIDLHELDTNSVTNMYCMFYSCSNLTNVNLSGLNLENVTNMSNLFNNLSNLTTVNISNLNTSNVTNMSYMFQNCTSLTTVDFTGIDTSHVTNMSYMFNNCTSLISIDVSSLSGNVSTNMQYMFNGCSALTTANVTGLFSNSVININASCMFEGCTSLTNIDLSSANMGTVKNVSHMFDGCSSLTNVNFSNASAVTNMTYLFRNCPQLLSVDFTNFGDNSLSSSSIFDGSPNVRNLTLSANMASKINNTKLQGNWKKVSSDTIYEYTSNKTTIPAEAGEYVRAFKLTFDCKGGNALTPVYKEYNGSITLGNPARPGFTFAGWYNEEAYTNQITSPYTITADKTIYAKWSGGDGATLVYWRIGKKYSSGRTLDISMNNLSMSNSYEAVGSFLNTASFNSESDVPWHIYRADIKSLSISSNIKCKSIAYWFKDMTRLTSIDSDVTRNNDLLENMSHAFEGCTNIGANGLMIYISNSLKNIDSIFKNCSIAKQISFNKISGVSNNDMDVHLQNNGFKDAFLGCSNLKSIVMRYVNFSDYTGDVFSFDGLTNLINIITKDSGNLFNRINLSGEWWVPDTGNKYTSSNMPTNIKSIYKYQDFSNKIYWYIIENEVHLSGTRPSNSNYKDGHYFNGDEYIGYYLTPSEPDDAIIVLDNNITIRNDAGDSFFTIICMSAKEILNLSYLDTSNVTSMYDMFNSMDELTSIDLSNFNTQNVTNMSNMFLWCEKLTNLNLSSFDTSNVTDMSYMFSDCYKLQNITLNSFNTSKVEDMCGMFESCKALTTIDLSSFTTTRLGGVGTDYNEDYIWTMFHTCRNLTTIYVSENFNITCDPDATISGDGIFDGCTHLVGGNGTAYSSSHKYADFARIDRAGTPGYFTLGGQGYIAPTNGGGNSDDGGSSSDDSGNNSGNNGGSSSGSSGGSGGGGGGSIAAIDNQINNMMNALNLYTPATTQVSTTKSINNNNSLNGDTSSWAKDPVSGKWKLTAINANGQSVNASNGFFQINSTVTQNINNTQVNSIASSTYYFDQNGNMVTGWVQTSDNKWYFFDNYKNANEGKMVTGWRVVGNNWYYFMPDGSMLQSGMTPDGYIVGSDGAYIV